MKKDLNKTIEELFNNTINVVNSGKEEINKMVIDFKDEYGKKLMELSDIQSKLLVTIEEVDSLSIEEKRSRTKLAQVSTDFNRFSEADIKEAYEYTHNLRARLEIKKQEERLYLNRRKELELNLKSMLNNIDKGEKTIDKLSKIVDYIEGNKNDINDTLEDINEIQMFGIKVIEAQEEERKRIARDIHDGPAQDMANIVMRAEYFEKIVDKDLLKAKIEIKELKSDVKKTLENIRRIIYDLRPMSLDDLGLIPTIEKYIEKYQRETGLTVKFTYSEDFSGVSAGIETALYRVIQEAFSNIYKHAKATTIYLNIEIIKDAKRFIVVKIEDDGIGFSKCEYKNKVENKNCGFGILGMKERVEILEGKFTLDSKENIGTIIKVTIPIIEEGRSS